jgi:hypothetical protein
MAAVPRVVRLAVMTSTIPRHADIDLSLPGGLHKSSLAEVPRASDGATGSIGCPVADPSAETGVA